MESNILWSKYTKCRDYVQQKGIVRKTEAYWENYIGNQWEGIGGKLSDKLPVLNFIKPTLKYKVSTICQHSMTANYSDSHSRVENEDIFKILNEKFAQSWEKGKMDSTSWRIIKESAIQGDSYAYWGSGNTLEPPQVLSNTTVFLGDENTSDIQKQPYIILVERLSLSEVQEIARKNGISEEEIEKIATDTDTQDQILNKEEVSDKVTVILYMERGKDGIIRHAKATKECIIQPFNHVTLTKNGETVTGLKKYPIINFVWERKPNSARGVGEVEQLIPNQVELNKTLARRAETVKLTAFPRLAYDGNAIENEEDLKKVGAPIKVTTGGAQSISQAIAYLNAANISSDAESLSNDLLTHTRDLSGAGDTAMGNINPERASGNAIMAVRDQNELPLNEQVSEYRQFVENVASLWFELWTTYEPENFLISNDGEETRIPVEKILKLEPSVRVDVSQDNQWTKLAEQQAVDTLLTQNLITLEEYSQLLPVNSTISKAKMDNVIAQRKLMREQQMIAEQMQNQQLEDGVLDNRVQDIPNEEIENSVEVQ